MLAKGERLSQQEAASASRAFKMLYILIRRDARTPNLEASKLRNVPRNSSAKYLNKDNDK